MGFFEFLANNLGHVMPIIAAGVFAAVIIGERIKALFVEYPLKESEQFFQKIQELLTQGKTPEAISLCDQHRTKPVAQVAKSALTRAHLPEQLIEHGLELAVGDATQAIQKRTGFLAMVANVATLLGLFGTILGLIHSFEAVGHADAQQKSTLLANGIATAMNATMMGLGVAIPCMIAFAFLVNRSNRLVAEMEHAAVRMMDMLKQRFYSIDSKTDSIDGWGSEQNEPTAQNPSNHLRRVS